MADSLLYVSKSLLPPQHADIEVERIVTLSLARNAKLDITGALISTTRFFAQVLEGPPPALAELMTSISRDPRHTDIRIVDTRISVGRRFPNWSMAYSGYAAYVDARIRPFFDGRHIADATASSRELIQLMREFVK